AFEFDNTSWAKVNPAGTGALKNGLAVGASDTLLIRIRQGQAAGTEYGSFTITGANGINLTVNASITVDYAVTFNGNGTGVVGLPAQIFADGTTIAKPAPDPTRSGFVFDGWYKESACTNIWDFDVDIVTANITLYARWISVAPLPDFELTVTPLPLILPPATSGSISTNNVGYQLTLSNTGVKATGKLIFSSDFYTADLYPDGMTSQDWNGIANNTGGIFQFDNTSWGKVNPATPGSLLAGLAPGASDTLICRARTGMPAGTFSYSFTITNETGEINVTVTASITIAAAGSFAAVFHHNADSDGVNVTNMPDPQNNLASGSAITAPVSDPVRPGYTFNGWYRGTVNAGNAGTNPGQPVIEANPWNFANTISANTILFAKWTKNP
ncbi:MAG: InlB B-repeat-containing protein, partial [Treponema sp.]|nr:InlB B-repeat-containing protein [Treponema sp.]